MHDWIKTVRHVEALEDVPLDESLISEMAQYADLQNQSQRLDINFYTPTFKSYQSSELNQCGKNAWPAISITGGDCKLQCDHCKAKILEPMIPARTPDVLWRVVNELVEQGAQGMLLTGGSNHRNEVEYASYYPVVRRIKDNFPHFKIAMHTALVDEDMAQCMEQSGVDAAMMDVIGAQETITQVYHLKRTVDDFEHGLQCLVNTKMKVVPHIVVGLHYGKLLGESNALAMLARHVPDAVVLVVVMPQYAPSHRPFMVPDTTDVGGFFLEARKTLADIPLLLGCARPAGVTKQILDTYAVMAGMSGIAHPAEGVVELAARLQRNVKISASCCSIAIGDEVMALDHAQDALELNLADIIAHEQRSRRHYKTSPGLASIPIVNMS